MERTILHVDCNKFYASVECLHHPEIRDKPVAVCGSTEQRHGIVLTKNEIAARFDVQTGETIQSAKRKCPSLITVLPNFPLYMRFSQMVRNIFSDYTDLIEPFGLDEAWLDVTASRSIFGSGESIAEQIRQRVKSEVGITVSIGVSFNKVFAKLGSDYKKPDAITVISRQNYRDIVWRLPANELLFIGPATYKKLISHYRYTIGDVAQTEPETLHRWFGKTGYTLHSFANGYDLSPVDKFGSVNTIKSIGNSTTTPRDLLNNQDVKSVLYVLSESVARRLREQGLRAQVVHISARSRLLDTITRQHKLSSATDITKEIADNAYELFCSNYIWEEPIRSVGITVSELSSGADCRQLDIFSDETKRQKLESIDKAVDKLKYRYGSGCIKRAVLLADSKLSDFDPYHENVVHPVGFF